VLSAVSTLSYLSPPSTSPEKEGFSSIVLMRRAGEVKVDTQCLGGSLAGKWWVCGVSESTLLLCCVLTCHQQCYYDCSLFLTETLFSQLFSCPGTQEHCFFFLPLTTDSTRNHLRIHSLPLSCPTYCSLSLTKAAHLTISLSDC
jgi:hypothetical protein